VQSALENVAGVKDVKIDYATKTAVVTAEAGKSVDTSALLKALSETRFKDSKLKA